uniref:Putative secreted protein n=1 Tax=Ixodes ricinus TaxID=34613 RepID=A0A6B0ULQ7_IXORI
MGTRYWLMSVALYSSAMSFICLARAKRKRQLRWLSVLRNSPSSGSERRWSARRSPRRKAPRRSRRPPRTSSTSRTKPSKHGTRSCDAICGPRIRASSCRHDATMTRTFHCTSRARQL